MSKNHDDEGRAWAKAFGLAGAPRNESMSTNLPRVFAIQGLHVLVLQPIFTSGDREKVRQSLKEGIGTEWVWFEDEVGTERDPIRGPNPLFGPGAAERNREDDNSRREPNVGKVFYTLYLEEQKQTAVKMAIYDRYGESREPAIIQLFGGEDGGKADARRYADLLNQAHLQFCREYYNRQRS